MAGDNLILRLQTVKVSSFSKACQSNCIPIVLHCQGYLQRRIFEKRETPTRSATWTRQVLFKSTEANDLQIQWNISNNSQVMAHFMNA